MKNKEKGFTLIELLVVISIITFLSSIVLGPINTARLKARNVARTQAVDQINKAIQLYSLSNRGALPDFGDVSCLDINSPNSDCVADASLHPDNWNALALQLKPYISELSPDPCPNCAASIFGLNTAYAATGDLYGYVYEAPAGTAAYLRDNGLSTEGFTNEGYRIYAKKLEGQDVMFGYGFGLNGFKPLDYKSNYDQEIPTKIPTKKTDESKYFPWEVQTESSTKEAQPAQPAQPGQLDQSAQQQSL